ncbi:iron-containing alcohol dehydrogenase [Geminicoccaceae bacterium 1502E]|nr:iron-containing alcohol dehydrogenase [Geminicoccaceae bacterium 1502E]
MGGGQVLEALGQGRWIDPATRRPVRLPLPRLTLEPSLAGAEAELVAGAGLAGAITVVCDENTVEAMGRRVAAALPGSDTLVLERPHADIATADALIGRTRHADALVAVGSGTINDLCKQAARQRGIPFAVFATAPSMNGYVTATASLAKGRLKLSLPAVAPRGAFFDLGVLAAAPLRLRRAGLGDVICRTTAQTDWLLAHLLHGSPYLPSCFALQAEEEAALLGAVPELVAGEHGAVASLTRLLVLGGAAMLLAGSSAPASQGEHLVSHYVDLLAEPHPGTLHGEQVAAATLAMARLQERILSSSCAPRLTAPPLDEAAFERRFGVFAGDCIAASRAKAPEPDALAALSRRLADEWQEVRGELCAAMLPLGELERVFAEGGLPSTGADLGLDPAFWRQAVAHARETRDRYTFLDLAAEAGMLGDFAALQC